MDSAKVPVKLVKVTRVLGRTGKKIHSRDGLWTTVAARLVEPTRDADAAIF